MSLLEIAVLLSCAPQLCLMPCCVMQNAQELLQAAAEAMGLRLKPLDKKAELALAQAQQDDLKAQLADETAPAAVLSLVVPLLVMQVRACHGHAHPVCDAQTVIHIFTGALRDMADTMQHNTWLFQGNGEDNLQG